MEHFLQQTAAAAAVEGELASELEQRLVGTGPAVSVLVPEHEPVPVPGLERGQQRLQPRGT